MNNETTVLEIITLLIFTAAIVGLVTRMLRLPYTVGLVLMGLLIGVLNQPDLHGLPLRIIDLLYQTEIRFTPNVILGLLVTPLIFEAAFHLNWVDLRRDLKLILALAIPGVILTILLVGLIVSLGSDIPLLPALVFGAVMGATDPVAVVALFRTLGIPKRLQVLLEGESLFNDGTTIVIFSLVLSLSSGALNTGGSSSPNWLVFFTEFLRVAGGGLLVGLLLGWLTSELIGRIDDHLIETALTAVLAFGSYLVAQRLDVSGVLAVVAAGLVNGNIGPRSMGPTTRIVVVNFWEFFAFISNSVVFLLIGLEIHLSEFGTRWKVILLAILAVLLARAVVVYTITQPGKGIPLRWAHILWWGGLRGAVSLALALTLPQLMEPGLGTTLQIMVFGVVLFTILGQGITMEPLVRKMRIVQRSEMLEEYERRHARAVASRAAYDRLAEMYDEGLFSYHTWQFLAPLMEEHSKALSNSVKEVIQAAPDVEAEEMDTARREALRAQRSALISLRRDGVISDENYTQLAREVDMAISESDQGWAGLINPNRLNPITLLMSAVIQMQDYENAAHALNEVRLPFTQLASSGGFLGRRNVTLLIGLSDGQEELAVKTLSKVCRRRVEYIATPLEGAPFHMPLSTPVTVGGATIFTMKVERYEELT